MFVIVETEVDGAIVAVYGPYRDKPTIEFYTPRDWYSREVVELKERI